MASRSRAGEGSLRRIGTARDGRPYWEIRVYVGRDPVTGKPRQVTRCLAGTAKEAQKERRIFIAQVEEGRYKATAESFAAVAEAWYASRLSSWSPTTAERNRGLLDLHILPALGRKPLSKLGAAELDRFYASLAAKGLAPATIRKAHAIIRSSLTVARKWRWISENPADDASPPAKPTQEVRSPSAAQVQAVMDAASRYLGFPLFLRLAAVTGARRGELCGLRWSDIDINAGTLRISRAVIEVDNRIIIKTPKYGVGRMVDLDELTIELVAEHMDRMVERAAEQGVTLVDDPYLFSESVRFRYLDGSQPWSPHWVSRKWAQVRNDAGVDGRLHGLRNFVATELLEAGVPLPTVSRRLGHNRTSTTSDIYAAFVPGGDRVAADVMGKLLERNDPRPAP